MNPTPQYPNSGLAPLVWILRDEQPRAGWQEAPEATQVYPSSMWSSVCDTGCQEGDAAPQETAVSLEGLPGLGAGPRSSPRLFVLLSLDLGNEKGRRRVLLPFLTGKNEMSKLEAKVRKFQ